MINSITIIEGLKVKDLPEAYKVAFEPIQGALPNVAFKNGSFYSVDWKQQKPIYWPDRYETQAHPGDSIIIDDDWGVKIVFANKEVLK